MIDSQVHKMLLEKQKSAAIAVMEYNNLLIASLLSGDVYDRPTTGKIGFDDKTREILLQHGIDDLYNIYNSGQLLELIAALIDQSAMSGKFSFDVDKSKEEKYDILQLLLPIILTGGSNSFPVEGAQSEFHSPIILPTSIPVTE